MYQTYIPNTNFVKHTRIHCYLGYNCNIECEFCTNRLYESKPTRDVVQKTIETINALDIDDNDTVIHLSGGELYQDDFDISIYHPLLQLRPQIPKSTITNLLYNNIDRCIDLWKQYNMEVWTSYDSKGRFKNNDMLELWINNLQYIKSKGIAPIINIIATPFSNNDSRVDYLCENNKVFFSPLENKAGNIVLLNLYHQMIRSHKCLNVDVENYSCQVININDTYVNKFCNIVDVKSV